MNCDEGSRRVWKGIKEANVHPRYIQKLEAGAAHPLLMIQAPLKTALRREWDELLRGVTSAVSALSVLGDECSESKKRIHLAYGLGGLQQIRESPVQCARSWQGQEEGSVRTAARGVEKHAAECEGKEFFLGTAPNLGQVD